MFDKSQLESLNELNHTQWRALERINQAMMRRAQSLFDELVAEGQDAGLDGDTVLDYVAGWLQVAVDDGQRLAYHLKHNAPKPDAAPLQLRDRAEVIWRKEFSDTTGRVISNKTGKCITKLGTPMEICREIAASLDDVRVEPERFGKVTISRLNRERTERIYDSATRTPASRARLQRLIGAD